MEPRGVDLVGRVTRQIRWRRGRAAPADPSLGPARPRPDIRDVLGVPEMREDTIPWLEAYSAAMQVYRPQRYLGRMTLLRARTSGLSRPVSLDRGWGPLADAVEVRVVKGNHASMLREPAVKALALALTETLGDQE